MSALEPITIANLRISRSLYDLVQSEMAPGTGLDPDAVWTSLGAIVKELGPENRRLLDMRARHEERIDAWHEKRANEARDPVAYRQFLADTGYLLEEEGTLTITTEDVDPEISSIAGRNSWCRWTTPATPSTQPMRAGVASTMPFTAPMSSARKTGRNGELPTIRCGEPGSSNGPSAFSTTSFP